MCAFLGLQSAGASLPVVVCIVLPIAKAMDRSCSGKSCESSFYLCLSEVLFTNRAIIVCCYTGSKLGLRMLFCSCRNESSVSMSSKFSVRLVTGGADCLCGTGCIAARV